MKETHEMQYGRTNPLRMLPHKRTSLCIASGEECPLMILNIPLLATTLFKCSSCFLSESSWIVNPLALTSVYTIAA